MHLSFILSINVKIAESYENINVDSVLKSNFLHEKVTIFFSNFILYFEYLL